MSIESIESIETSSSGTQYPILMTSSTTRVVIVMVMMLCTLGCSDNATTLESSPPLSDMWFQDPEVLCCDAPAGAGVIKIIWPCVFITLDTELSPDGHRIIALDDQSDIVYHVLRLPLERTIYDPITGTIQLGESAPVRDGEGVLYSGHSESFVGACSSEASIRVDGSVRVWSMEPWTNTNE